MFAALMIAKTEADKESEKGRHREVRDRLQASHSFLEDVVLYNAFQTSDHSPIWKREPVEPQNNQTELVYHTHGKVLTSDW